MRLSDTIDKMELSDVCIQYYLDKDIAIFIRNLIAVLNNYKNPQYQIRKIIPDAILWQPRNQNLTCFGWYDTTELSKIIQNLTGLPLEKCQLELKRASTWYTESRFSSKIPVLVRTFYLDKSYKVKQRLMAHTNSDMNNGRRKLYRRHPITRNVEMVPEQVVKGDLMILCDLKGEFV